MRYKAEAQTSIFDDATRSTKGNDRRLRIVFTALWTKQASKVAIHASSGQCPISTSILRSSLLDIGQILQSIILRDREIQ